MHVQVFVYKYVLNFLGYIKKNRTGASQVIVCLIFWRSNNHFPKWLTHFTFPPTMYEGSNFLHLYQHLLLSIFFIVAIIVVMKWHLIVVCFCISLMTNDAENFFMCLLTIFISSSKKCIFKSFAHFVIGLFVFFVKMSFDFFGYNSSDIWFANTCSQFGSCLWLTRCCPL